MRGSLRGREPVIEIDKERRKYVTPLFAAHMAAALILAASWASPQAQPRPLLREIMGINGHTVLFKPELYKQVCRLARDYHPMDWDVGNETHFATRFPFARNMVNWESVYGSWVKEGFTVNPCVMFETIPHDKWHDLAADAFAYGFCFARFFGPSGTQRLCESIEIGNEPGLYDDATYRTVFENMAGGVRKGDPKMKIATCAVVNGPSHRYAKSLECFKGLENLYDVISFHCYAEVEGWPTWRRSFPEDPKIKFLREIRDVIAWRDKHAPGKAVWLTEFGWDACTKPPPTSGDFAKWESSTETQQAQWLVRAFLVFARIGLERAYVFFFDDKDEPHVHGSSGITREYKPKPSFYALAHLFQTLGEYRFERVLVEREGDLYVYDFRHGQDRRRGVRVAWSPTGSGRRLRAALPAPPGTIQWAQRMPLKEGPAESVSYNQSGGQITLDVDESPVYMGFTEF